MKDRTAAVGGVVSTQARVIRRLECLCNVVELFSNLWMDLVSSHFVGQQAGVAPSSAYSCPPSPVEDYTSDLTHFSTGSKTLAVVVVGLIYQLASRLSFYFLPPRPVRLISPTTFGPLSGSTDPLLLDNPVQFDQIPSQYRFVFMDQVRGNPPLLRQ